MSVKALTWAFDQKGLTPTDKLVLLALADHADPYGVCWPSQFSLADKTNLSMSSVKRAISRLAKICLIKIEPRKTKGVQQSNRYVLNLAIMVFQGVTVTPGKGSDRHPEGVTVSLYESSIEPSIESSTTQAEKQGMNFEGDVDSILKSHKGMPKVSPEEAVAACKKVGGVYSGVTLGKLYRSLIYWYMPEFKCTALTGKQEGQLRLAYGKAGDDFLAILVVILGDWVSYVQYVAENDFKAAKPLSPSTGYILTHIQAGVNFAHSKQYNKHVQSTAKINKQVITKIDASQHLKDSSTAASTEDVAKIFEGVVL